jgi:transcriptional regulator with XRE-family HTH domain
MNHAKKSITAEELGIYLGKKIARYRKEKRMTQAMLAAQVSVDNETISRFERGTALPSLLRLFEIAQVLEVGVGDLLAEASSLARDTERSMAGMLDEISPADQKLLGQIAGLLRGRK